MAAKIKPHSFNLFHTISIIGFVKNPTIACSMNGVYKGAAMLLFYFLIAKTGFTVLNERLSAEDTETKHSRSTTSKIGYCTTHFQVVDFLHKTYATDEVITKTKSRSSALCNRQT